MRDWKSMLGVVLVFVLGCLAGVFVSLAFVHHRVDRMLQRGSPAYEQMLEWHLSHGLHLNSDQRERFHETFVTNIEERKKIQAQLQPQIRALNNQTHQEIKAILTPEQMQQFRHNLAEFRRRFGPPGLGGGRAMNPVASPAITTNAAPTETGTNAVPDQL
jgi:hypothetical protein